MVKRGVFLQPKRKKSCSYKYYVCANSLLMPSKSRFRSFLVGAPQRQLLFSVVFTSILLRQSLWAKFLQDNCISRCTSWMVVRCKISIAKWSDGVDKHTNTLTRMRRSTIYCNLGVRHKPHHNKSCVTVSFRDNESVLPQHFFSHHDQKRAPHRLCAGFTSCVELSRSI